MHAQRPAAAPTDPVLTPRLVLTPVGPDDVDDLLLLYSDPVVAHWTGPLDPRGCGGMGRGHGGPVDGGRGRQMDGP